MRGADEKSRLRADNPLAEDGGNVEGCALESAARHIARCKAAGSHPYEGGEEFSIAFYALAEWGEKHGLIRTESEFPFLQREADGYGDEHQAWFDERSNLWFKATYLNQFGLAWGSVGSATAEGYLNRLILQNRHFGDNIQLIALLNCDGKLRVLTSQPHIAGTAATYEEIQEWFVNLDFVRLVAGDTIAWYHKDNNLLVADAHEGNVVKDGNGLLIPIDLNIIQPVGEILRWARTIASDSGECPLVRVNT